MRALSLIEPWASLVVFGVKKVETRSWGTGHRGRIAIHASMSKEAIKDPDYTLGMFEDAEIAVPAKFPIYRTDYNLGHILGIVDLVGCEAMTPRLIECAPKREKVFGAWQEGRYAWHLSLVRRFAMPVQCKGALGLWEVPEGILENAS